MSSEELRQEVFSSIHLSSLVKSTQASITYPSCSYCGGGCSSSKGSPKRKVALCQLTLYTNSSESFVVWCKKQEDPKGMLWLGSYCIRKGQDGAIELISRSCRGRCSYTLKFSAAPISEEWHTLLKQESRRVPSICDELSVTSTEDSQSTSLDRILDTDSSPLSTVFSYLVSDENDENGDDSELHDTLEPITPPTTVQPFTKSKSSKVKSKKNTKSKSKHRTKSTPVLCNPLQGRLGSRNNKKSSPIPVSATYSSSVSMGLYSLDPIDNDSDDQLSRWSWPLKA